VAELRAVVALRPVAAGWALRGNVAEVAAVEALLAAAAGPLRLLGVRVRRRRAVAANVPDFAAVVARLAASVSPRRTRRTRSRRGVTAALRAVALQVSSFAANVARAGSARCSCARGR